MASLLLGIDDALTARELVRALVAAGHQCAVVPALDTTAAPGRRTPDVLILDGDAPGMDVAVVAATWRRREPPPRMIVLGATAAARAHADRVHAPLVAKPVATDELLAELHELLAGADEALSPSAALRALGLAGGGLPEDEAALIINGSRTMDVNVVREALRPHMYHYAAPTRLLERVLQRRALGPEEARLALSLDGGRTIRGAIDGLPRAADDSTPIGALSSHQAARVLWALASSRAVVLGPEPPPGHRTARMRAHLVARRAAFADATHYQLLELGIHATAAEIDQATVLAEIRFGDGAQNAHDLGDLAGLAAHVWEQIVRARLILGDPRLRAAYDTLLVPRHSELEERRQQSRVDAEEAERLFQRGQQGLAAGDVSRAVSDLAAAARRGPGHPDYEACAAWGRFVADETRATTDAERKQLAERDRAHAEDALLGRRSWPRAMCALGLLAEAGGDGPAAISYLREALLGDERLVAARQALARLGG